MAKARNATRTGKRPASETPRKKRAAYKPGSFRMSACSVDVMPQATVRVGSQTRGLNFLRLLGNGQRDSARCRRRRLRDGRAHAHDIGGDFKKHVGKLRIRVNRRKAAER